MIHLKLLYVNKNYGNGSKLFVSFWEVIRYEYEFQYYFSLSWLRYTFTGTDLFIDTV